MSKSRTIVRRLQQAWLGLTSSSSAEYWERRYRAGLDSGPGSFGELARFKSALLNNFVQHHDARSVIEFGCGDGNQLSRAKYPRYLGLDVSAIAIEKCIARFAMDPTKSFIWYKPTHVQNLSNFLHADVVLSLDVIYHLVEDAVYEAYLRDLFGTSDRFVVIYSSDRPESRTAPHVRHRQFSNDVARLFPEFGLKEKIPNPYPEQTFADFYFYERLRPRPEP